LQAGVHATVGASGARQLYGAAGNRGERRLERILHRAAAGLGLPAEEATAVVLQS
jgi:hypothetical protein